MNVPSGSNGSSVTSQTSWNIPIPSGGSVDAGMNGDPQVPMQPPAPLPQVPAASPAPAIMEAEPLPQPMTLPPQTTTYTSTVQEPVLPAPPMIAAPYPSPQSASLVPIPAAPLTYEPAVPVSPSNVAMEDTAPPLETGPWDDRELYASPEGGYIVPQQSAAPKPFYQKPIFWAGVAGIVIAGGVGYYYWSKSKKGK